MFRRMLGFQETIEQAFYVQSEDNRCITQQQISQRVVNNLLLFLTKEVILCVSSRLIKNARNEKEGKKRGLHAALYTTYFVVIQSQQKGHLLFVATKKRPMIQNTIENSRQSKAIGT